MPKKRDPVDEFVEPVTAGAIKDCVGLHDVAKKRADLHNEDAKAAIDTLERRCRLRPDAVKTAMKLRKLGPADCKAWLDSFNATVAALALDAQLDLIDAANTARRLADEGATTSAGRPN